MTTWYAIKGELVFATKADAKAAYDTLVNQEDSVFHHPDGESRVVKVEGVTVHLDDGNFSGDYERVYAALGTVVSLKRKAIRADVRVEEGEDVSYIRKKPSGRAT